MMDKHPRRDKLLKQLALLNPDDGSNPDHTAVVELALDKVVSDVANYTHLNILDLPEGLDPTIVALTQQFLATHELLTPAADRGGNVKSISEGDTSVTFKSPSEAYLELQSANTVTDAYLAQLNVFRVVKW
ncbi:head-tail connector protein [Levilactobacillus namurensis]|nr:hypothetical protein [Levilactobacillus namurensis]